MAKVLEIFRYVFCHEHVLKLITGLISVFSSDPVTGIPTLGTTQYSGQILTQNYNKLVHSHLFPNSMVSSRSPSNTFPLVSRSVDRLLRYERSLSNQYRKELDMDMSSDEGELLTSETLQPNESVCNQIIVILQLIRMLPIVLRSKVS